MTTAEIQQMFDGQTRTPRSGLEPEHDIGRTEVIHVSGHANSPRASGHQGPGSGCAGSQGPQSRQAPSRVSGRIAGKSLRTRRDTLMGDASEAGHALHPRWVVTFAARGTVRGCGDVELWVNHGPRHVRTVGLSAPLRAADKSAIWARARDQTPTATPPARPRNRAQTMKRRGSSRQHRALATIRPGHNFR